MATRLPDTPQLGREIANISTALDSANADSMTRLPESVFVNNFLPMFAGEEVPPHINPSQWAAIAGSPYRAVVVVDGQGQALYEVPPLLEREGVDPTKVPGNLPRMAHVLTTTNQLQLHSPRRADAYLRKQLAERGLINQSPEFVQRSTQQWNEIFSRYGKPLIGDGQTPAAEFTPQKSDPKTELTYGDDIL